MDCPWLAGERAINCCQGGHHANFIVTRKRYVVACTLAAAVAILFFLLPPVANWSLGPSISKPHSDLPITPDLGQWPSQEGLIVTGLTAEAVNPRLNLFNGRFLIRYRLTGTITCREGTIPSLAQAQITHRLVARSLHGQPSIADVLLVPVVEVTSDRSYFNQPIPFTVKLEEIIQTVDWGDNRYEIRCLDKSATVSVQQGK